MGRCVPVWRQGKGTEARPGWECGRGGGIYPDEREGMMYCTVLRCCTGCGRGCDKRVLAWLGFG
jgi:hypothetical protein